MNRIKVLQMIDRPFLGGGQINVLSLAETLPSQQFDVSVCTSGQGPLVDILQQKNIPHFFLPMSKRFRRRSLSDIASFLGAHRFDILHTHGGIAGFYGRMACRKRGSPRMIVHTLHGIHYLHYRNPLLKRLFILQERYLARRTDAVIFVSEADKKKGNRLHLVPEAKQVLIKNGIDYSACVNRAREIAADVTKDLSSPHPVVGSIARLHRQKGISYLLRAVNPICRVFPELKIWIIGGGPQKAKLERLGENLGVASHVHFFGERQDILQLMSCFDVFVLPSLWEGLPYSLLEAAAIGKPVVATDIDGVRELIQHEKTGLLVTPRQPEMLAEAIIRLLRDPDYASGLGQSLNAAVRSTYTLERMVSQVKDLYLRLLQV